MGVVDLRSDVVTQPTEAMRKAMYEAELGDDVSGEDPTVNRLEELAAQMLGKEASLLVSSGTQGNLLSVLASCRSGDEIIVGDKAHIYWNEAAGVAALGGIQIQLVTNSDQGSINANDVEAAIRPQDNLHYPRTTLVCLENTQNLCNGGALTASETESLCTVAHANGIPVHLDGARLFNAAISLETPVQELVMDVDNVTFCLSKGLSAPVGSVLCGSREFIAEARRWRKMVGGGMRQAGIIAAAGLVALETMIDRLAVDHANTRYLSLGLSQIDGIIHERAVVQTNILFFKINQDLGTNKEFIQRMREENIKINASFERIRMVVHRHITVDAVESTLQAVSKVIRDMR